MEQSKTIEQILASRAERDESFRERMVADPKRTIEQEFHVTLPDEHEVQVHEQTYTKTHIVLPPRSKFSEADRQEAKSGAKSIEFLRKTLYDPAPLLHSDVQEHTKNSTDGLPPETIAKIARQCIRRGLEFVESTLDDNGAWHCIRYNVGDSTIPRHYERPPFISAFCALALKCSNEPRAKALYKATQAHLVRTIEYPGLWRYYRHLPNDLDSTAVCSLVIADHPWIYLGRNISKILTNRNETGHFMTWVLDDDEPNVVSQFRIEADPVVNANIIAYLGDIPETTDAQRWLGDLVKEGSIADTSKWYPDPVAIYYAIARAIVRVQPAMDQLRPLLNDGILDLCDDEGNFKNVLQTAQAATALYNIGSLEGIDMNRQAERIISSQRIDGSWPEILAFGDQSQKWGLFGQIGHASESVTSAFCIEALERITEVMET